MWKNCEPFLSYRGKVVEKVAEKMMEKALLKVLEKVLVLELMLKPLLRKVAKPQPNKTHCETYYVHENPRPSEL